MVVSSLLAEMSPADQERFHRLSDFVEELNRRLFQIEELLSEIAPNTVAFENLSIRYHNLLHEIQEMENILQFILRTYGLSW